jgi:biotin transporter BioY
MTDIIVIIAFIIGAAFLIHRSGKESKLATVAGYVVAAVLYILTAGTEWLQALLGAL